MADAKKSKKKSPTIEAGGKKITITPTGFKVDGGGKVFKTPDDVRSTITDMSKSDARKFRKALYKGGKSMLAAVRKAA